MRIQTFGSRASTLTSILILTAGLAACGGGSSGTALDGINGGGGSSSSAGGDAGNDLAQIGAGNGTDFRAGEINVGIGESALSAGGNTLLSVNVVNNGSLITDSVQVTFTSPCFANEESLFEPRGGLTCDADCPTNVVNTSNGQASIRYIANGCVGSDSIQATTSYGGSVISASATIEVEADTVSSLSYIDADPQFISLKGTGGDESTSIRFRVKGSTGAPMKDVNVSFELNTTAGGLKLVNDSAISDNDGYVSTTVQSGTVPTSVRITATTDGGISTQSSEVVVSTGLPDQNSMSIAASDIAPNSWNFNGVTSEITVNVADAFNNPAPDGTPVYFTTSGGAISSACLVSTSLDDDASGRCSVTWQSQNPRPEFDQNFTIDEQNLTLICPDGNRAGTNGSECRDGRLKIVATTIGNESFIDSNGNGLYDPEVDVFYNEDSQEGDPAARRQNCLNNVPTSGSASHQTSQNSDAYGCDDLGDPYIDRNFNGRYDAQEEIATINEEVDQEYNYGNEIYNGVLCRAEDETAGLCSRAPILVRDDMLLVMSCNSTLRTSDGRLPGQPTQAVDVPLGGVVSIAMLLADCNGNGIPGGTELSLDFTGAGIDSAEVYPNGGVAKSQEPGIMQVVFVGGTTELPSGLAAINIEIPGPFGGSVIETVFISVTSSSVIEED
ncbi:Ig-like domain-containing protein [Gilvimarinus sp. SDUM040013]|uniref:Ig-like domain-containing protein n=1 Tax=Gilvimarinus gilvus TaxID=3058038 RepID=A0ABU4RYX3_9GAMM|nr:Ig-like domain-containing protein [Gilvimarinus sp. SDUM040013]MDO3387382.1 Ig-like domain-containing protein [Gilvimarinus sp. SDUM040013]MDX6849859.1 Ig-like domain-containing protein [Gilvimarinus sp. SDUM040013]